MFVASDSFHCKLYNCIVILVATVGCIYVEIPAAWKALTFLPPLFPVTVGKLIKQAAKRGQIALASLEKKKKREDYSSQLCSPEGISKEPPPQRSVPPRTSL